LSLSTAYSLDVYLSTKPLGSPPWSNQNKTGKISMETDGKDPG
jgi:hypothetical protein